MTASTFWMVTRNGGVLSGIRHSSMDAAKKEACCAAERSPGEVFVVMEAMAAYRATVKVDSIPVPTQEKVREHWEAPPPHLRDQFNEQ